MSLLVRHRPTEEKSGSRGDQQRPSGVLTHLRFELLCEVLDVDVIDQSSGDLTGFLLELADRVLRLLHAAVNGVAGVRGAVLHVLRPRGPSVE